MSGLSQDLLLAGVVAVVGLYGVSRMFPDKPVSDRNSGSPGGYPMYPSYPSWGGAAGVVLPGVGVNSLASGPASWVTSYGLASHGLDLGWSVLQNLWKWVSL